MKQQISPVTAVVVLIVVIGIAALAWFKFVASGPGARAGEKPPGMPADVAKEFARRQGSVTGPPQGSGTPMPMTPTGAPMPMAPPGMNTAPPATR